MKIINQININKDKEKIKKRTLIEVILQVQFESNAVILKDVPFNFHEKIKTEYPTSSVHRPNSLIFNVTEASNIEGLANEKAPAIYQYSNASKGRAIAISHNFFSLSSSLYNGWTQFSQEFLSNLSSYEEIYSTPKIKRIGLRYRNIISKVELGITDKSWQELITPDVFGISDLSHIFSNLGRNDLNGSSNFKELDLGDCRLMFQSGIAEKNETKERVYYLDTDLYIHIQKESDDISVINLLEKMEVLHGFAFPLFRH